MLDKRRHCNLLSGFLVLLTSQVKKQHNVNDHLSVCLLNIICKVSGLPSSLAKKHCESGYIDFSNDRMALCRSLDQRVMSESFL